MLGISVRTIQYRLNEYGRSARKVTMRPEVRAPLDS